MGRKLYVGNLPYQTGETELTELFSRAGTVESARIMRDTRSELRLTRSVWGEPANQTVDQGGD